VLLKIYCDYERKEGRVESCSRPPDHGARCAGEELCGLADGDTIRIDAGQVLRCNFTERLLERNAILSAR